MFGFNFIIRTYESFKSKTIQARNETLEAFFKGIVLLLFVLTLIWISIFLYIVFYYAYVPSIEHVKPVNLEFLPCEGDNGSGFKSVCSFPRAHIQLTKANQLLMVGQPYRITVSLELPESKRNRDIGMFLVCAQILNKNGNMISHSCRTTMLRYRSPLLNTMKTVALSPFYMFNFLEQKQNSPATDMYVELKSEQVEVYSSKVQIDAHFSGLRYMMFHWPILSGTVGVFFNLAVIVFIVTLSWMKLYGSDVPVFEGNEFIIKLKEKLSPKPRTWHSRSKNEKFEREKEGKEKQVLTLKSEPEEELESYELERKLSSSEA